MAQLEPQHVVYVAGPYTKPDPGANVNRACIVADLLVGLGFVPFVPHAATHLWHLISPKDAEYWYDYDLHFLLRFDALLRIHGESWGADREEAFAREHGIPVFHLLSELSEWARRNPPKGKPALIPDAA